MSKRKAVSMILSDSRIRVEMERVIESPIGNDTVSKRRQVPETSI